VAKKNGKHFGVAPSTFVRRSKKLIGGELHSWGTDLADVRGPVIGVRRKGEYLEVTCKWLARFFKTKKCWKVIPRSSSKVIRIPIDGSSFSRHYLSVYKNEVVASAPIPPFIGGMGYTLSSKRTLKTSQVVGL